jgi:hypothetical protein
MSTQGYASTKDWQQYYYFSFWGRETYTHTIITVSIDSNESVWNTGEDCDNRRRNPSSFVGDIQSTP